MSTTKPELFGTTEDKIQRARYELDDAILYLKLLLKAGGPFPPSAAQAFRIREAEKVVTKRRAALNRLTSKQRKAAARDAQATLDIPPGGSGQRLGGDWGRRGKRP